MTSCSLVTSCWTQSLASAKEGMALDRWGQPLAATSCNQWTWHHRRAHRWRWNGVNILLINMQVWVDPAKAAGTSMSSGSARCKVDALTSPPSLTLHAQFFNVLLYRAPVLRQTEKKKKKKKIQNNYAMIYLSSNSANRTSKCRRESLIFSV